MVKGHQIYLMDKYTAEAQPSEVHVWETLPTIVQLIMSHLSL